MAPSAASRLEAAQSGGVSFDIVIECVEIIAAFEHRDDRRLVLPRSFADRRRDCSIVVGSNARANPLSVRIIYTVSVSE
jgi:hypothetical protein